MKALLGYLVSSSLLIPRFGEEDTVHLFIRTYTTTTFVFEQPHPCNGPKSGPLFSRVASALVLASLGAELQSAGNGPSKKL